MGNPGAGDGYYYTIGAGAAVNTGFAYASDSVFTLSYTQQSATAGMFTIGRTSASTPAANGTVSVPFTASGVTSFRVYNSNATNSSSDNVYFNNRLYGV